VLHYGVRIKALEENVACAVPNPEPKRREVPFFPTPAQVEAVADELGSPLPLVAAWTGLRPEEWLALERRDVDRERGVVHVRRVFTDGRVKPYGNRTGAFAPFPSPRERWPHSTHCRPGSTRRWSSPGSVGVT
jgi:integrase